jgi:hypothetical protein
VSNKRVVVLEPEIIESSFGCPHRWSEDRIVMLCHHPDRCYSLQCDGPTPFPTDCPLPKESCRLAPKTVTREWVERWRQDLCQYRIVGEGEAIHDGVSQVELIGMLSELGIEVKP